MTMINEIFELYRRTLPAIKRNEDTVMKILGDINNYIVSFLDGGKLAGVSVINDSTIYLLCVDKSLQNQGIGTALLNQSEKYISSKGFDKVVIGAGKEYIVPGVPMNENAHVFFKNRGYSHSWGDSRCFDMSQSLADFHCNEHNIGDTIDGITYRWASINDLCNIIKCVKDAEESFVKYYQDKELYVASNDTIVLVAEIDNEIIGTLHVSMETEGKGVGSVGCTTTIPKHQGKGIASSMVRLGTKHLKDIGLAEAFLSYTYTEILSVYRRSGYEVSMEYYMGAKAL